MAVDQAQLRLAKAQIIKLCQDIKPQAVFVRLAWHDAGTFDIVRIPFNARCPNVRTHETHFLWRFHRLKTMPTYVPLSNLLH